MVELREINETANRSEQTMPPELEKCKELVEQMHMLLTCVDHKKAEACSISLVQEQLRKSNVKAYTPQVVSIGPIHKGRTSLLYMEEIKLHCVKHLFKRTRYEEKNCLFRCSVAMLEIDQIVRAAYVEAVKLNSDDLAKIMVIDGCFLLELLISASPKLEEKLKCGSSHSTSPGRHVLIREEVLSDLALLENQIPLVVLVVLSDVLFPEEADVRAKGEDLKGEETTRLIQESALSIFGYSADLSSGNLRAFHFVQFVHAFMDIDMVKDDENPDLKFSIENGQVAYGKLKLQRCATKLEAAGVTIKPPGNTDLNRFDLKVKFSNRNLEIPQLHITKTTEAKWRNLIAWELNRTSLEKHQARKEDEKTKCRFICYAWFIQSLVCCVHDVKLLREKEVLVVDREVKSEKGKEKKKKIMSDEDLLNLFRKMTEEVSDAEIEMDPWFVQEIQKLNSYTRTVDRARETSRVMWHILRCFVTLIWWYCRVSYRVLRRDYIPTGWKLIAVLAAAAGLALTATQTYYSIHPQ